MLTWHSILVWQSTLGPACHATKLIFPLRYQMRAGRAVGGWYGNE
jgi:hypothetical protein